MPERRGKGSLIRIDRVSKSFGSVPALDDVSLEIASGEFLTLLGPSGSGKTTLLMVLAGFVRADQGSLTFDGREMILAPPHQRGVGMVFQNYALFPHMTVAGNIGYPLRLRRVTKADIAARVAEALRTVRLESYGERRVHELSGGQRQRVALARAIVFEPGILLMDEPLSALDKKLREAMQLELRQLHDRLGMTTVYVTHDQREALTMSDRIAVINQGRLEQAAAPGEIYDRPVRQFVADFIGEASFLKVEVADGRAFRDGIEVKLATPASGPGALLLRPEKLAITDIPDHAAANVFDGIVRAALFQGDSGLVVVDLGEVSVHLRLPVGRMPAVGSSITLALDRSDSVVVPP